METTDISLQPAPHTPHVDSAYTAGRVHDRARFNLYSNPHKALRVAMGETLSFAGRVDPLDDADVDAFALQVRSLLRFCRTHLDKEEEFIHPAMETRRPGSSSGVHDEHREHLAAYARLEAQLSAVEAASGRAREIAVTKLYASLAIFVADNLVHMHVEESENNETLRDCYSEEELVALEQRLVASIPQELLQLGLRWMVPAMNPAERATLLRGIRVHAPAAAFDAIFATAQASLGERERRKLARALAA